jgi:hypothetical protein
MRAPKLELPGNRPEVSFHGPVMDTVALPAVQLNR